MCFDQSATPRAINCCDCNVAASKKNGEPFGQFQSYGVPETLNPGIVVGVCEGAPVLVKCKSIWVVVKITAPFWVPIIIWPLTFRVPKKGP